MCFLITVFFFFCHNSGEICHPKSSYILILVFFHILFLFFYYTCMCFVLRFLKFLRLFEMAVEIFKLLWIHEFHPLQKVAEKKPVNEMGPIIYVQDCLTGSVVNAQASVQCNLSWITWVWSTCEMVCYRTGSSFPDTLGSSHHMTTETGGFVPKREIFDQFKFKL